MTVVEETETSATYYEHTGLMPVTGYCYRVFGVNVVGTSTSFVGFGDAYAATYDADAQAMTYPTTVPGMPMNVEAMATSDTAITVSWTAPADNGGADITGYIIERAYGDVMFLDHADAEGDAFTDAKSWWDGLGCEAMVEAVNDDRPADEETNPFCKMYDDIVAEADRMTVDEYFMKRYVVITDPATTSYMDMDLMAETEYMYRVKAVNAAGAGMWSNTSMDTTEATNMAPGVPTAVTAMETSDTEITVTWGSPASDGGADITGYMVESAYMMADGTMSDWMAVDPAHTGMEMMYMDTGLMPETMYYYQVRAMNAAGNGEWSDGMASAMTDPTPVMTELGMATNLRSGFNDGGTIQVTWDPADNAVGYIVIAIDKGDLSAISDPVNPDSAGVTHTTLNLGGLTVGREYNIYVAATGSADDFTLSAPLLDVTAQ